MEHELRRLRTDNKELTERCKEQTELLKGLLDRASQDLCG